MTVGCLPESRHADKCATKANIFLKARFIFGLQFNLYV